MTDTIRDLLISLASHMAYMQGQLEARHELDPKDYYWYRESVLLRQKVTDALLAAEPAVPEGREPAAVITEPSDEKLLVTLRQAVVDFSPLHPEAEAMNAVEYQLALELRKARAVLARWGNLKESLTSSPPADGEVKELVAALSNQYRWTQLTDAQVDRAAELLQRQVLVPVSVSARPWEREGWCDAEGRCWWGRGESDDWSADWTLATPEAVAEFCEFSPRTVCLPAHVLPLPEVNNG